MNSLILQDRSLAKKFAFSISGGELVWSESLESAVAEPIVLDGANHWKIFSDNGELSWEITATVQDDQLIFYDNVLLNYFELNVIDGELDWRLFGVGVKVFQSLNNSNRINQELSSVNKINQELLNI